MPEIKYLNLCSLTLLLSCKRFSTVQKLFKLWHALKLEQHHRKLLPIRYGRWLCRRPALGNAYMYIHIWVYIRIYLPSSTRSAGTSIYIIHTSLSLEIYNEYSVAALAGFPFIIWHFPIQVLDIFSINSRTFLPLCSKCFWPLNLHTRIYVHMYVCTH